jgi:hypothetical protein
LGPSKKPACSPNLFTRDHVKSPSPILDQAQVQHNMCVTHCRAAVLSIITGGGKWVEITIPWTRSI